MKRQIKNKKYIIVLIMLLIAIVITACSSSSVETDNFENAENTATTEIAPSESAQPNSICVGDEITFGYYGLNENSGYTEELQWTVLEVNEDSLKLITSKCINGLAFDDEGDSCDWNSCTLRTWLNGEFLEEAFTFEEREKILTTTCKTKGCEDTSDKVFILSYDEAKQYFYTNDERVTVAGGLAKDALGKKQEIKEKRGIYYCTYWWLRTQTGKKEVDCVTSLGKLDSMPVQKILGVRPVIQVQYENSIDKTVSNENKETEENTQKNVMMSDMVQYSDDRYLVRGTVLGSKYIRTDIRSITFLDSMSSVPNESWDVSVNKDGSVKAWVKYNTDADGDAKYDLYIAAEGGVIANKHCQDLFGGYSQLLYIKFNNSFDTSNTVNMSRMFDGNISMQELDVSGFDASNVTDMEQMFKYCNKLEVLDVSKFDTSKVKNFGEMFNYCTALKELDVSNFSTDNATDMNSMFGRCSKLENLNVSGFSTANVTNMNSMFIRCESLTSLDVSNFDTSNVTDMSGMFSGCTALLNLDTGGFDMTNAKTTGMFNGTKWE